ncbi:MAG: phage tail tape measure protein, partial [Gilliamella apicola]|nr:phage tail tape measure protein [Gilliamella apicola]
VYQNAIKSAKATRQAADEERKLVLSRKQLADSGDKLYTSFRQQIDSLKNSSASSKELEKITAQLGASYKSGNLDINNYKQLLVDVALKHKEVASAEQNASNVKISYSNQLKAQAAAQDLSKEQMLKYQSAQLGAGYSADVYFKKVTRASTATKSFEDATRTATTQAASMYLQIMKGDFSGFQTSLMSMVMQNGVGNTFSTLLTSLNPLNIGISAAIGLFGSMIPKLFEAENAAEQLAAAQEHLNKVLTTDKQSGMTFLSDEMMNLLQRNKSLVEASLKLSEKDLNKVINSAKKDLQDGFKGMESFWKEFFTQSGTNGQSELKLVLDRINSIKSSGKDLNAMLSANDQLTFDYISGIKGKIENYSEYFGITKEKAQSLLEQMAAINSETDSEKASEKINNLISEVSNLYSTTNMNSSNLDKFIKSLLDIAEKADDASLKVKRLSFLQNNMGKAVDPKKSPFYQYAQLTMTPKQRADEEIKDMKAAAKKHNKIVGKNSDDYLTDKKINDTANAIYARHLKEGRSSSTSNILQTSQQQEISLINQLNTLREQSSTLNTMTSERQKYFELQAQIETLENQSDKSKLTAQEKYILGHKEALLAQQEKNAALSEEIEQYQASIKALQQIREYTANIVSQSEIKQATFGMTSKQSNRATELIQLDKKEEGDLEKIKDPTEVAKITEKYTEAKQALEQSWQLEDQHEGDWFAGLKLGINEFAENGLNVFNGFRDIASNAMGSVSRSLTELVTTGKTDFKSLTKSILTNIIEIINKLLLAKAIQSAMGWLGGGAGGGAGAATGGLQQAYSGGLIHGYAKGGGVGYNNEPGGYTGNGNKYTPAGIVHKGEFVFTKESTKRIGVANLYALMREAQHGYADGGYVNVGHALPVAFVGKSSSPSNSVNVNTSVAINMQSNNSSQPQAGNINQNALEAQIKPIIQKNIGEALQRSTSPGGDLYILLNR